MASFTSPGQTDRILSSHITQIIDSWNGVAGMGVPFQNVTVNSTTLYAADIQNLDTTNGYGLRVRDAAGNVLIRAYKNNLTLGASAANDALVINANISGKVFIGDTACDDLTTGLVINQGAATDNNLILKNSTADHGMTTRAETDTYGMLGAIQTSGGLGIQGFNGSTTGLVLYGYAVTDTTAKSSSATGYVGIYGAKKTGTTAGAAGANANLLVIVSGISTGTKFILDSDGDSHQAVGTAWTTFPDEYDDVALLNQLSAAIGKNTDALRAQFGVFLEEHKKTLEALRIVTFNPDGVHFLNNSRLQLLLVGAVRQLAARVERQEQMLLAGGAM